MIISDPQSTQIWERQDRRNIYAIIKIKCPLGYHHKGIVLMIAYILRPSCLCKIWALCVSWITYDYLYYVLCLASCALFGSLVPVMWNHTSCGQVLELPQSHCVVVITGRAHCFHDCIYIFTHTSYYCKHTDEKFWKAFVLIYLYNRGNNILKHRGIEVKISLAANKAGLISHLITFL